MAADFIPSTALFLGIIPALVLLYISIKGHEDYLTHKYIYLAFIGGIIIGFIAAVIEIYAGAVPALYVIVVFPVFEQLFKTIILNLRRLHEKKETVIYGLTLGLGFGSVATAAALIRGTLSAHDYLGLALVVFGSIGLIMLHGATGLFIGFGVFRGKLTRFVTLAIVLHILLYTGLFFIQTTNNTYVIVSYLFIGGLLYFWYATRKILPQVIVESQRRKRTQKEIDIKTK